MHFHVNLPLSVTLEPIAPLQSPHQKVAEALSLCIQRSETWVAGCLHGNISESKFCSFGDHMPWITSIWYDQKVVGRSPGPCIVPLLQDTREAYLLIVGQNLTSYMLLYSAGFNWGNCSMEDAPQDVYLARFAEEFLNLLHNFRER